MSPSPPAVSLQGPHPGPGCRSAILLAHCPDRLGINAAVTKFLAERQGNILDYDQHVDPEAGVFFLRIEWDLEGFRVPMDRLEEEFRSLAESFHMTWSVRRSEPLQRMAVLVSRQPHCLYDILSRRQAGEWPVEIPVVIGNHPELEDVAKRFGIPFACFPVTPGNRAAQEERQQELLRDLRIDVVVLARYMQILSGPFVRSWPHRIINIHHSFLPAFAGARPYHAAYARGVKIIGATSHYATETLDQGPIIAQDVIRVSHKDSVAELIRKGRDLEKIVLARAVWSHLRHKILVYNNKTVLFDE